MKVSISEINFSKTDEEIAPQPAVVNYIEESECPKKKLKLEKSLEKQAVSPSKITNDLNDGPSTSQVPAIKPHKSPKKKLQISSTVRQRDKFIYGNYSKYYGYRIQKDFHDIRLDVLEGIAEEFRNKNILDIGCNSGLVTIQIAKKFSVKHITGIDIDRGLINRVNKEIVNLRKSSTTHHKNTRDAPCFPFNINFVHGNYVLRDDVLLDIESEQFDLILCLSVTKWIHLNFGDTGLKQSFRRMFLQLKPGGKLILEAQLWDGYKRRKKLTPDIFANYQSIRFKPAEFTTYLLSDEVGFKEVRLLAVPNHCAEGFRRPIQMFSKAIK